jgi:hypothetical protein
VTARRRRSLKRAGVAALIVAIAALVVAAILGGGRGPFAGVPKAPHISTVTPVPRPSASGPTLTASGYRSQANAICDALPNAPAQLGPTLQAAAPVMNRLATDLDQALAQLSQLQPPPSIAARASHALALFRQEDDLAGDVAAAASAGDQGQARADAVQLVHLMPTAASAWQQLGAPQC